MYILLIIIILIIIILILIMIIIIKYIYIKYTTSFSPNHSNLPRASGSSSGTSASEVKSATVDAWPWAMSRGSQPP
jgi:predicted Holliday junction resolvase-like endonuclease